MSFKNFLRIKENKKLMNVCKEIQENILDDWFNFEDSSVGIWGINQIDDNLISEFEDGNIEECKVKHWAKDSLVLLVDDKYVLYICLDRFNLDWIIEDARMEIGIKF